MHQVVQSSAELHIDCVANHEDVRDKDKHGEQPPAKMPMSVERHRSCKNCSSFRMQQPTRTREHERECLLLTSAAYHKIGDSNRARQLLSNGLTSQVRTGRIFSRWRFTMLGSAILNPNS